MRGKHWMDEGGGMRGKGGMGRGIKGKKGREVSVRMRNKEKNG